MDGNLLHSTIEARQVRFYQNPHTQQIPQLLRVLLDDLSERSSVACETCEAMMQRFT